MKQQDDYIKFLSTVERTKDGITLTGPVTAGGGTIDGVIWYPRPERLVVDVAQYAKPDTRIAELETALRNIRTLAYGATYVAVAHNDVFDAIYKLAADALSGTTETTGTVYEEMAI